MSNVIQIKHGPVNDEGVMPSGKLAPYELGYASNGYLYIGGELLPDGAYGNAKTIKVHYAVEAQKLTNTLPITKGGTGAITVADARTNLGLGEVAIESIVPITKGGTGATTAANARTNLGLGAASVEDVIPLSMGGTGAITASDARVNLGLDGRIYYKIINSGDDLNNYITPGFYRSTSAQNVISNSNGLSAFELIVTGISDTSYCTQVIKDIGYNNYYIRTQTNWQEPHTWTEWSLMLNSLNYSNYALSLTGGALTGSISLVQNNYLIDGKYGINCNNSDIIHMNGLYFNDVANGAGEGINFNRLNNSDVADTGPWDTLYSADGALKFHPNRPTQTIPGGYEILHKGIVAEQVAYKGVSGTTPGTFTFSRQYSFYLVVNYHKVNNVYNPMLVPRVAETRTYHIRTNGNYERTFTVGFSGNNVTVTNVSPAGNEYFEVWGVF